MVMVDRAVVRGTLSLTGSPRYYPKGPHVVGWLVIQKSHLWIQRNGFRQRKGVGLYLAF